MKNITIEELKFQHNIKKFKNFEVLKSIVGKEVSFELVNDNSSRKKIEYCDEQIDYFLKIGLKENEIIMKMIYCKKAD